MIIDLFLLVLLGILGLIIGSFLTSLTYQIAKPNFSWAKLVRRSKCPKCAHEIIWHDNIPLLSYLVLGGKCRLCKKPISKRYPLLEALTALIFIIIFLLADTRVIREFMGEFGLPYLLFLAVGMLALAVVDLEHQIIPDKLLLPILIFHFLILIFLSLSPTLFVHFFWASLASCFFLALVLVTRGRGMGLGDVKLSFLVGLIVGPVVWLAIFLAFIAGAIIGLFLVFVGQARFGKPIPFGPFLVLGTLLVLLFGEKIVQILAFV